MGLGCWDVGTRANRRSLTFQHTLHFVYPWSTRGLRRALLPSCGKGCPETKPQSDPRCPPNVQVYCISRKSKKERMPTSSAGRGPVSVKRAKVFRHCDSLRLRPAVGGQSGGEYPLARSFGGCDRQPAPRSNRTVWQGSPSCRSENFCRFILLLGQWGETARLPSGGRQQAS